MKRYRFLYLFGFVGMCISIGLDLIAPQITRRILGDVIVGGQRQLLAFARTMLSDPKKRSVLSAVS